MIDRYSLPEMSQLWNQQAKYDRWLEVELAVLEVQETLGKVPQGVSAEVRSKATFNVARIDEIEAEVKHDVIAFLTNLAESVGENSRFVHLGMTSSDLIDTAVNLQVQASGKLLQEKLNELQSAIREQAFAHRHTVMVGRSHGIHGEPITFGLKLLVWVDELERQKKRLTQALEENRVGQVSGAMGTYAHLEPEVERLTCEQLSLIPATVSTQILQRDRMASLFCAFAQLASSLEKVAVELRHLQRTEVLEVEEAFTKGQKGSSAMPHKRNPISGENITGLARMVRSYVMPALENVALWHERDISHSSVERIILPDGFILLHYMLNRMSGVIRNLQVYPENMKRNMNLYGGVIFSQRVMLGLVDQGILREDAYRIVQKHAHEAWNREGGNFKANLLQDPDLQAKLSAETIEALFDPSGLLRHVDTIFERFEEKPSLTEPVACGI